jgi:hypothetical protein
MDLTTFQNDIKWVTRLDPEPEIYAQRDALYVDFYGTADQVSKAMPDLVCIDLWSDDETWIAWEDATIHDADALQRFRWIVTVD